MDTQQGIRAWWQNVTTPRSPDAHAARHEYATRVVLVIMNVATFGLMPWILGAWGAGLFSAREGAIVLVASLCFAGGWWLTQRGHWQVSRYVPLAVLFAIAVQENYTNGAGSPAMLYYVITIALAMVLVGKAIVWFVVGASIVLYGGMGWAHAQAYLSVKMLPTTDFALWAMLVPASMVIIALLLVFANGQFLRALAQSQAYATALQKQQAVLEQRVTERTAELKASLTEQTRLQQQVLEAQQQLIRELSTPVIPLLDAPNGDGSVIVLPLVGNIDSQRAQDILRALLAGISQHRAQVVILDITGVPFVDTGIVNHLNKTIQAARLKGARVVVTGISDAVAEAIVNDGDASHGIAWGNIQTLADLQTGLRVALERMGMGLQQKGVR